MDIYEALKHYYGYDSYRSNQSDIITSLLNKNNTIAILPTGGGKSVCFQIPALLTEGLCIVVTPLISLMADQVYELRKMNIEATLVNSTMDSKQIIEIYENLNNFKFLYLSPERLESSLFLKYIKDIKLSFIIIDEAHCIETWGSIFRTSFQNIYKFTSLFDVAIGCFTATSTSNTLNQIVSTLNIKEYNLFQTSLSRDNLMFEIIKTNNKLEILKQYLLLPGVKIIYCSTVVCVEKIYKQLKDYKVTKYHGKLNQEERNKNQDDFIKGRIDIIIATNAFGMGINKSNVRYVFHYEISSSIEDYYQEAGRAGRDTLSSKCIILFNEKDFNVHYYQRDLLKEHNINSYNKKNKEINSLKQFVSYKYCLESFMKKYFDQSTTNCMKCYNCLKKSPLININIILLDYENYKNKFDISMNNIFLIEEYYNQIKVKYKKYNLYLKENKSNIHLIYDFNIENKLRILNKEIYKKEKINVLSKKNIILLIYLKPKDYKYIENRQEHLNILKKYNEKIQKILYNYE